MKCLEMFCREKQRCQSVKTPKELVHTFSRKFEMFTILLRRENVFGDVLVEKLTFLRQKNVMLGKWQNLHLSMVLVEHLKFLCFLCRQNRSCKSVEYSFQGEKQLFFKSKHKKFQDLFLPTVKKGQLRALVIEHTVHLLRHDAYCPIKAEIRAVDSQSDLRILLQL